VASINGKDNFRHSSGWLMLRRKRCGAKTDGSAWLRFSFCKSCRNLLLARGFVMPLSSFLLRLLNHKSLGEVLERAGTPIAKLLSTTTLTAPSGASREKNEGRGCLAEGALCRNATIAIGRPVVPKIASVIL
jgi:hypothetical protein